MRDQAFSNFGQKACDMQSPVLAEIEIQLDVAMDEGDEEVELYLAEQMDILEPEIAKLEAQLESCKAQAEDAIDAHLGL